VNRGVSVKEINVARDRKAAAEMMRKCGRTGVRVGAPPLAALILRWPRRTTLLASQAVFVAALTHGNGGLISCPR